MNDRKKEILIWIAAIASGLVAVALVVYKFVSDCDCVFLALTNIPCPACGMTRATFCFLTLRFSEAFGYHPLFWAPYLAATLGLGCIPHTRLRKPLVYCVMALFVAFIAVWVARVAFFDWRG